MNLWTKFPYVDAMYEMRDKKKTKWIRMLTKDVDKKIRNPSRNQNCFQTVQQYKDSVRDGSEKQIHYCGLFLDFDAKPEVYGSEEKAIFAAYSDVQTVIEHFRVMEIEEAHMRLWYSGAKGFHLLVCPEVFGIRPSRHLTYIIRLAALYLSKRFNLKTLDLTVYTNGRQWRLPNSIHQSSGRFKIELYHGELSKGYEWLIEKSKGPREELYDRVEFEDIGVSELASEWWEKFVNEYEEEQKIKKLEPAKKIVKTSKWPVCIQDIMENGLKASGTRNKTTMALASYFKDSGYTAKQTEDLLLEWLDKKIPKEADKVSERIANTKAVISNIFSKKGSQFSCAYIRALSSGTNRVACEDKECDAIERNPENQRPKSVPKVPLSKASEAVYLSKTVNIPVMITGKGDSPYGYPKRVTFHCIPNLESQLCQSCRIAEKRGKAEVEFNMKDQTLIDLINCTDARRNAVIKRAAGVPHRCYAHRIDIDEYGNLEELRLQPNVLSSGMYDSRPGGNGVDRDPIEEGKYCTRLAYYIGHDIEINKKYDIVASVWAHPQNQKICHIFDEAHSSQDDIDKFRMTRDIYKMLVKFHPTRGQTVREKFREIHDDLEKNVHMIWGRREVAIALDLCYHSVIGFNFQGVPEKKGWIELLILGDSGNGKTKLVERVMNHYQLGEITGVEGGKRTGLIWANHNVSGRFMLTWGKIPQNDRRLIVLDEFSGMPDEEVAQMTRLRTEGIAESQGINPAQTNARARLVFLSNARNGKTLDSYNYGIEAINHLFKEHQDVRRIDLAVCVKSGDVPLEVINKKHSPDFSTHEYHTDLCKLLVLWAWSREPRQIRFLPESEDKILSDAITLGKKYRCDISLVEPSDQRLKVARLSCAVAARTFSTDEDGELLIVKPEHVEFATDFIQRVYDHRAMEYNTYASEKQERMFMNEEKLLTLKVYWKKLRNWRHLKSLFLTGSYFRKGELIDQIGYTKDEVGDLLQYLSKNYLITATTAGYRKTPMFTAFLKNFDRIGSTDPPF